MHKKNSVNSIQVSKANNFGFTLLEISIALTILAILSYGAVGALNKVGDFDDYVENKVYLEKVQESLLTYVQVNSFLPCPDTDGDGVENRELAAPFECSDKDGQLPYLDLGVNPTDIWNQPLYYAVNNQADNDTGTPIPILDLDASASYFSDQSPPVFGFNTPPYGAIKGTGNYTVCGESATSCAVSTCPSYAIECAAIAVVISFGKNGANTWARRTAGTEAGLDDAETENADDDNYFWQAAGSNAAGQEFDDQLVWLTGYDVKYAVIKSGGTLP
ncbi:type II secretion system protein [Thiomicrorhabdus lithotrophica]|uniref:Type II secretion system GspH family protein n=1 Tax=Thiomicrorhabdus lithotrophica TaxID=2949997 RepID=A0ABY8C8G6_9GAMM|nr:type II secretion system protein [Thiomicrorhabdus lithotrophica]WEJ62261.1 type II secretion system GspH family protein [Thiomicrorhabdus lithotrophica]